MSPETGRARRGRDGARSPESAAGERDLVDTLSDGWRTATLEVRPEYELAERAARLGILLQDALTACVAPWSLTKADYAVLRALRGAGAPYELRPTDIKARLLLTSGGVAGVLNRLEQAGLAVREPDGLDGRSSWVRLTREGIELADTTMRAWAAGMDDIFRAVPTELASDIADKLRHVLVALGDREPPAAAIRRRPAPPARAKVP